MTYDADGEAADLLDHLLSKQRRYNERRSCEGDGNMAYVASQSSQKLNG